MPSTAIGGSGSDGSETTSYHVLPSSTATSARTSSVYDSTSISGARNSSGDSGQEQTVAQRSSYDVISNRGIGSEGVPELVGEEVDFDNFEDFDDNLSDEVEEMETVGREGEVIDIPGHHDWPRDDNELQQGDVEKECDIDFSTVRTTARPSETTVDQASEAKNLEISTHSGMEPGRGTLKSKVSLRAQKSGRTRVCELKSAGGERGESQRVKNPRIASVKPMRLPQHPIPRGEEEREVADVSSSSAMLTEFELYEEPIILNSISEVENNSWKSRPFVKIKVYSFGEGLLLKCSDDPLPF